MGTLGGSLHRDSMVYPGCSQLAREGRARGRALDEEGKAMLWACGVTLCSHSNRVFVSQKAVRKVS